MEQKKVVYIAGPITGVDKYWEAFEKSEDELMAQGYITISPARLPQGLKLEQYMMLSFASINQADAVYFLPDWQYSKGACLERDYCYYIGKEVL